ncbi:Integrase [Devosia lucknowensis]|uniref:Integrase n=1 Tax=Devosia lucknowensis TaxID=1096929 RepID=A0A1Y6ETA9_9HYPH|nr:Integrase [Devosia lucknowensis]
MARNKLTVTQINASTKTLLGDGDGLYLRRSKSGTRSWIFVYHWQGKRRELGLGSYNSGTAPVGLVAARKRADDVRAQLTDGIDPMAEKRKVAAIPTFGKAADDYIAGQKAGWSNSKHGWQWEQTLGDAYCSSIRNKSVAEIGVDDIVGVLEPIWLEKAETATRLRMRLEKVLDFAKVKGWRSGDNPAVRSGNLIHLLPTRTRQVKHHAALAYADVPGVMAKLTDLDGVGAEALRFTILTASRSAEVFGARWDEFDFDKKVWIIPPERMKARQQHTVPLSDAAVAILKIRLEKKSCDFVFPGQDLKTPISNMTMGKSLKKVAAGVTVHGMRSAFRDWAGDMTNHPREIAEAALAHKVGNAVEQAYRRSDALEKRRALMVDWANFCTSPK